MLRHVIKKVSISIRIYLYTLSYNIFIILGILCYKLINKLVL